MAKVPGDGTHPYTEDSFSSPAGGVARKPPAIAATALALVALIVVGVGYLVGYRGPSSDPRPPVPVRPGPTATLGVPVVSVSQPPPPPGRQGSAISMGAACKWAYPGQASGLISGTGYSITCLGAGGRVLGGFRGQRSLNAWCADPRHTDGKHAPDPSLVEDAWTCGAVKARPAKSGHRAHPEYVLISMSAACRWAYPGRASGLISGTGYSITCLGTGGQVLGGFRGQHSLNAWCADPGHADGETGVEPEIIPGGWACGAPGSQPAPGSVASAQPAPAPSVQRQPVPGRPTVPRPGGRVVVAIPMGAACKWAYPGRASGLISGTGYSITCLGAGGQVLGGFRGQHSLNAWCADPRHTDGKHAPDPSLVKGSWACTAGQPAPGHPATPKPGGQVIVLIPMSAACKWAYPGQASGQISGTGYSITCLGTSGQVLGGFGGQHSLNAWCADPRHTDGKHAPDPSLVKGSWACTAGRPAAGRPGTPRPGERVVVAIPMSAACKWAYPGQASGLISGSGYSITCLGTGGQVLGGFGGQHSLNAWCADPRHTDGKHAPDPSLIKGSWACTA